MLQCVAVCVLQCGAVCCLRQAHNTRNRTTHTQLHNTHPAIRTSPETPGCNKLQHTATSYNTLQHKHHHLTTHHLTATHCNTPQQTHHHLTATHCNTLQHTHHHLTHQCEDTPCSVLQCVAVYCSVLQCVAVCCSVLQCVAVCCSVLQCVAVCAKNHSPLVGYPNTLQHTATNCNTHTTISLQHTATHTPLSHSPLAGNPCPRTDVE